MIEFLIVILCAMIFFQRTPQRVYIAALYSGLAALFAVIEPHLSDMLYYVLPAAFDLILIFAIFRLAEPNRFTDRMIVLGACSLLLNCYGWIIYQSGMDPVSFVALFHVIYGLGIYIMLRKDRGDGLTDNYWLAVFRLPYSKRGYTFSSLHKKAQT